MSDEQCAAITARVARHGLIPAECAALTGGTPDADGVAICDSVERIDRAAYTHYGAQILVRADSLPGLVGGVEQWARTTDDADRFRIDVHDPGGHASASRTETSIALADVMAFDPDLRSPQHRFSVIVREAEFLFGEILVQADAGYRRHDDKPWTTSSSLDSRFARGLVNLVPDARSVLDPCCGAGSIVVEAASLGLAAFGVDWKPAMVGMTRENLGHFGYDGEVVRADSRTHEQPADAVVTDLPYGNAIDSDEREIRAILERSAGSAPLGVFVAPADISTWLVGAGYADIAVHTVLKRRGFTRWIHTARSTRAT